MELGSGTVDVGLQLLAFEGEELAEVGTPDAENTTLLDPH